MSEKTRTEIIRLEQRNQRDYHYRCQQVADLHISEIHHGVLPMLGPTFLSRLYGRIAQTAGAGIWLAIEEDRLVGFLAGCIDLPACYRSMLIHDVWGLFSTIMGLVFSKPRLLVKLCSLASYPLRKYCDSKLTNDAQVSQPELLAIAVAPDFRGRGVGTRLIGAFEDALRSWGFRGKYFVSTNVDEFGSNLFYGALGFQAEGVLPHHDLTLQLYSKTIDI